jgi:PAS domain S-box-containing protein
VFQVKAANSQGVWNEAGASLRLVITPFWWETMWFKVLVVMLILGGIVGTLEIRVQLLKAHRHRLKVKVQEHTSELQSARDELIAARDDLEVQVQRRTAELQQEITEREQAERKLGESEIKYRTVADFTYDWEWWETADGTFKYISPSCECISGYTPDEFMQTPELLETLVQDEDLSVWRQHRQQIIDDPGPKEIEFRIRARDGQVRWIEHLCQPVLDTQGRSLGIRASNRDITVRKAIADALKDSQASLRRAQSVAQIGSWEFDIVQNKLVWSDQTYRIFGVAPETALTYDTFLDMVFPDDRRFVESQWKAALNGDNYDIEHRILVDGQIRWVRERAELEFDVQGKPTAGIGTVQDISDLKQAERILRRSREQARALASRLLSAQEEERRLLARELHDDLTQRLAVVAIEIGTLEGQLRPEGTRVSNRLGEIREEIVKLSGEVHSISRQIHPAILEDLGLADAMKSEIAVFSEREGISVTFEQEKTPVPIPKDVALVAYRVMQESLRNIAKHAKVEQAEVLLAGTGEAIELCIKDSGAGFVPDKVHGKVGMASMEERARLVNGELSVKSAPGQGTVVNLKLPL